MNRPDFGPIINKTDDEVDELLTRMAEFLSMGDDEQDDEVILPWDDAKDLLIIAQRLWYLP